MDHPLAVLDPVRDDAPAGANGTRNLVVLNPVAGQTDTNRVLRLLAGAFAVRRAGFDVVETRGPGDAEQFARQAAAEGYRAVVAAGGDGTVGEVITGLAGTGVPLGIVPKGTGDQVAFNLGLPRSIEAAVDVVVNGAPAPMDLGQVVGGRYFAVAAGTGWDASVVALAFVSTAVTTAPATGAPRETTPEENEIRATEQPMVTTPAGDVVTA